MIGVSGANHRIQVSPVRPLYAARAERPGLSRCGGADRRTRLRVLRGSVSHRIGTPLAQSPHRTFLVEPHRNRCRLATDRALLPRIGLLPIGPGLSSRDRGPSPERGAIAMGQRKSSQLGDLLSRFSHHVTNWVGSSWAFAIALVIVIVWAVTGPVFHY